MKKWLYLILAFGLTVLAALWWLGHSLDSQKPDTAEQRQEIEHVF